MSRRQHRALLPRKLNTNLALKPRNRDQNTVKTALTAITVSLSLLAAVSRTEAVTVTLYNGTGLPANQNPVWIVPSALRSQSGFPVIVAPSETQVSGGVQLNTAGNNAEYSGYSNYTYNQSTNQIQLINSQFPPLDRNIGYNLSFNVALNSSTTNSNDRSAFSVTAISSDRQGIELGFEPGLIFAQSPTFVRAENAAFNTNSSATYTLTVQGSGYTLSNGSQSLSGSLRSYNFNPLASQPPLPFNPYTTPSFLFFGDNTGQESGTFTLGAVSVTTNTANAAVPFDFNPTVGLVILGAWTAFSHLRTKQK